jgi:hypothetical protein
MSNRVICLLIAAALGLVAGPAGADGVDVHPRHHVWRGYNLHLPRERHVIEIVDQWGHYYFNGRRFTPVVPACPGWRWVAGQRIKFLAGDMNGFCKVAVIYNYRRHQSCEFWCPRGIAIFP